MRAVVASPWPLYVRVLMKDALSWRSSVDASLLVLPSCVEAAVNALLNDLEHQLGVVLVSHALAFITAVPHGLCEVTDTVSLRPPHTQPHYTFISAFIFLLVYLRGPALSSSLQYQCRTCENGGRTKAH